MNVLLYLIAIVSGALTANYVLVPKSPENSAEFKVCTKVSEQHLKSRSSVKELIYIKSNNSEPCKQQTTDRLIDAQSKYTLKQVSEVNELAAKIKIEILKSPETEEEIKRSNEIKRNLKKGVEEFTKNYPRFKLKHDFPSDSLYFGIHSGAYDDVSRFLGKRVCTNPSLSFANEEVSYLTLFFSLNFNRSFGGIVRIINERIVTLIEGSLEFRSQKDSEEYFEKKMSPDASFKSWVHEDLERDFRGFVYQDQSISDFVPFWKSYLFTSPWLYNSCSKSISTVDNKCSLDPSYDMELKDFYYLSDFDLMLGNVYCKKSYETSWTRLATIEFVRTR